MKRKSSSYGGGGKRRRRGTRPRRKFRNLRRGRRVSGPFRNQSLIKTGFPRTTMVKLRYVEGVTINAAAAQVGYHYFRANSVYDPNYTGGGHQPMNYDLWSQLYNHYVVVGAKCTAYFHDDNNASSQGVLFGIALTDDHITSSDPSTIMEQGTTSYRMGNGGPADNSGKGLKCTRKFSAKKFFNITNINDNIARLGAGVTSDPTELAFFSVFCGHTPGSTSDLAAHLVTVILEYLVIFSEPKEQGQS